MRKNAGATALMDVRPAREGRGRKERKRPIHRKEVDPRKKSQRVQQKGPGKGSAIEKGASPEKKIPSLLGKSHNLSL